MADLYFVYRGEGRGWSLTSYKEKHKVKGNFVNCWAVDGSNKFPCYKQLFEKSEEQSIQLENAVTWSKSPQNIIRW
jgi:hypothetical protein